VRVGREGLLVRPSSTAKLATPVGELTTVGPEDRSHAGRLKVARRKLQELKFHDYVP
jgi:hypothetical protein